MARAWVQRDAFGAQALTLLVTGHTLSPVPIPITLGTLSSKSDTTLPFWSLQPPSAIPLRTMVLRLFAKRVPTVTVFLVQLIRLRMLSMKLRAVALTAPVAVPSVW